MAVLDDRHGGGDPWAERTCQIYLDTNRLIRDTFAAANYPVPEQHVA